MEQLIDFYSENTELSLALVAAVVVFGIFKPKYIWKIVIAVVLLGVVASVISMLGDTLSEGSDQKEKMGERTEQTVQGRDM